MLISTLNESSLQPSVAKSFNHAYIIVLTNESSLQSSDVESFNPVYNINDD